ncbi:MAG: hypothetical protein R3C44_14535 [Chloroflexota bacterium]
MEDTLVLLINLFILLFVLTSMFGTGLSLTVNQIIEPLKDIRMVALALVANFILVPAIAYLIATVFGLPDGLRTGLIVIGAVAGAPFLPKLVQVAKGEIALSVGLMILLMVVTVIYAPLVLPFYCRVFRSVRGPLPGRSSSSCWFRWRSVSSFVPGNRMSPPVSPRQ